MTDVASLPPSKLRIVIVAEGLILPVSERSLRARLLLFGSLRIFIGALRCLPGYDQPFHAVPREQDGASHAFHLTHRVVSEKLIERIGVDVRWLSLLRHAVSHQHTHGAPMDNYSALAVWAGRPEDVTLQRIKE